MDNDTKLSLGAACDINVESVIEKIKVDEQDKESVLKSKREIEANIASLNRRIKEASIQAERFQLEITELGKKSDTFRSQLEVERLRCITIKAQVENGVELIQQLRIKNDKSNSEVMELRTKLSVATHELSEMCDVWALMMTTKLSETLPLPTAAEVQVDVEPVGRDEDRMARALERRQLAREERDRLKAEPEVGDEFVRLKNALSYSLEMTAELRKAQGT